MLADSAGTITDRMAYDAYGNLLQSQDSDLQSPASVLSPPTSDLGFCGEQFDTGLQMAYHRARYYDQSVGLWNRLDPFSGNHSDPQSLHKYAYCHSDPVNGIDPSGEFLLASLNVMGNITTQLGTTVAGATSSVWRFSRRAVGVPISIITGDAFGKNEKLIYAQTPNPIGRALVTINGIWKSFKSSQEMNSLVAQKMGFSSAIRVHNPTFLCIGDLIQIAAHELLAIIDSAAVRAAKAITAAYNEASASVTAGIGAIVDVVAHSQGTMIFRRALELLPSNVKASIRYQGFGGETFIDRVKHGLGDARNVRNYFDPVPWWGTLKNFGDAPGNWEVVHVKTSRFNRHAFTNYIDALQVY
jgi:RHS repeat-associated protein